MDAVEFFEERRRMCTALSSGCKSCKIFERTGGVTCQTYVFSYPQEAITIVEQWAKEHPKKTRQSEFLKMFPRTDRISDGVMIICPESMDSEFKCPRKNHDSKRTCECCQRKYWLEEVEE